jgi:hexosaminidase
LDKEPHPEYGAEPPAGQLDPLEPFTYTLLNGLIKEWAEQFPDAQVHTGGDEINYKCWKTSHRVRDYVSNPKRRAEYEKALPPLKANKMIRTRSGAQSAEDKLLEVYLDRAMGMYLSQGKRPIVWEELALEHNVKLPDNVIVQVWKDADNAKRGMLFYVVPLDSLILVMLSISHQKGIHC